MIKVLAIDDEPLALRQLMTYIDKVPYMELVASCLSASEARPYVASADAIFLDISMPDLSGIDFIKSLPSPPLVVFTTAYPEYALEGFRVNAVDYLLKPFSYNEFFASCEKLHKILELRSYAAESHKDEVLHFKANYRTVNIPVSDIIYIESMSEYVKIYMNGAETPFVVLYSMKHLINELPQDRFIRIHRSYIVSLPYIAEANRSSVILKNGVSLPVGEVYRADFSKYLASQK